MTQPTLPFRLGRRPAVHSRRTMRLALVMHTALAGLGTAPTVSEDYVSAVLKQSSAGWINWWNSQLGDCLVSGTLVSANGIEHGLKIPYHGDLITICTESGKKLTVTANHRVLSERGWIAARLLKQGDNLFGSGRSEPLPWASMFGGKGNVYQTPSAIEQIFSSLSLTGGSARKIMPIAIDFHGDEKFVNGDIDVVRANRLLSRESHSSLRQPHPESEIRTTGKLQRVFARTRSALKSLYRGLLPAFGDVSLGHDGSALCHAHAGISQADRLGLRTHLVPSESHGRDYDIARYAEFLGDFGRWNARKISVHGARKISVTLSESPTNRHREGLAGLPLIAGRIQPSSDGIDTDAGFARDLANRLSGFVHLDRVVHIDVQRMSHGFVYDLSTDGHWYFANGIISHNCVCEDSGHEVMLHTANAGSIVIPTAADIEALYEAVGGYVPGNASTDQGCDETSMESYMLSTGLCGQKSVATGPIDPTNLNNLRWAVQIFGACRLGIIVDDAMLSQFSSGQPWTTPADPNDQTAGGHDVPIVQYDAEYAYVVTWGKLQPVVWSLVGNSDFLDEAHCSVWPDFCAAGGTTPAGFDLQQMVADAQAVEAQEAA